MAGPVDSREWAAGRQVRTVVVAPYPSCCFHKAHFSAHEGEMSCKRPTFKITLRKISKAWSYQWITTVLYFAKHYFLFKRTSTPSVLWYFRGTMVSPTPWGTGTLIPSRASCGPHPLPPSSCSGMTNLQTFELTQDPSWAPDLDTRQWGIGFFSSTFKHQVFLCQKYQAWNLWASICKDANTNSDLWWPNLLNWCVLRMLYGGSASIWGSSAVHQRRDFNQLPFDLPSVVHLESRGRRCC